MIQAKHTLAVLFFAIPAAVSAMTPQEAADAILGRNGDRLQIENARNAKDLETLTLANAPDPEVEGEYLVAPTASDNRWSAGLTYGVEWPGVYRSRRHLAAALREANSAEAKDAVWQKYVEILKEIGNYIFAERKLLLLREVDCFTDSLVALNEKAHRGGEISTLALSKIKLEHGRIHTSIANLEAEKNGIEGNLKTLNGGMDCKPILASISREWEQTPLFSLQHYLDEARTSPELEKVIAQYKVAQSEIEVAKMQGLPGFTLGYSHLYEDGMHFNGASLGVSIPLFSNRGKVKAAKAAQAVAEYEMTVTTDRLESDVEALYEEVKLIDETLVTPMEVFSTTDYNNLLLKAYRGGEMSLTSYLQERSWFYESHLDLLELQYQREQKMWMLSLLCKDL